MLAVLGLIAFATPIRGVSQDPDDLKKDDEVKEWRQTTCLLDGSTKRKKTGTGCKTFDGCPGLKDWLKIGPDVINIAKEIKDATS
ncbi:hypothetical protein [Algoriphagus marincola]|uniref:hypothetical protein n=1 Tax=Algoriphagus marincola TaxID=264027 RepID=UPI00041AE9D5|nr:hypothetical protein [Algoriphagus marincola]